MDSNIVTTFGRTRSDEPITNAFTENLDLWSSQEIVDAYALFTYLVVREKKKRGNTAMQKNFSKYLDLCKRELEARTVFRDLLDLLGLKTTFHVIRFGGKLALIEFSDF